MTRCGRGAEEGEEGNAQDVEGAILRSDMRGYSHPVGL